MDERDDTVLTTAGEVEPLAATLAAGSGADAADAATARAPTQIGRYTIERRLGAGAMGVVWEAIDPELGRHVAIKVIRDARAQHAERLRREAQALAQLHHPNVVAVYDVGVDRGELYVVMQRVAGETLDRAVRGRSPRDILALVMQAGRGLAAAHAAGIVHRDFKPTNVLVDADGTARVSDFGLARVDEARPDALAATSASGLAIDTSLTRGELAGTPAYMAPEQWRGGPLTHATDQFAFCVTLWEALAGERPYAGGDLATLRDAVLAGRRRELPRAASRRVRAVLTRGLADDPDARFPSMAALLEALVPHRRNLAIAGVLGVAALGTAAALLARSPDRCADAGAPMDAIWTDAARATIRAGLGAEVGADVLARLDARASTWKVARVAACRASGERAAPVVARLVNCLDRSLDDHQAIATRLAGALDADARRRARHLAASGVSAATCERGTGARTVERFAPAELRRRVAEVRAALGAGAVAATLAKVPALERELAASGDLSLTYALDVSASHGYGELRDRKAERAALQRAAEAASSDGLDVEAANAWAELAALAAQDGENKAVDGLLAIARAAAARVEDPDDHARALAEVALAEGRVALERGDFTGSIAACRRARTAVEPRWPTDALVGETMECVGSAAMQAGDYPAAIVAYEESRAWFECMHDGEDRDAQTIDAYRALATARQSNGDAAGAAPLWRHAIEVVERLYGADSAAMMHLLRDRALAQAPGGSLATPAALADIERADALADRILAPDDPERAGVIEAHAAIVCSLGDKVRCADIYARAVAWYEKLDDAMGLTRVLYNQADALRVAGHCDLAIPLFTRAVKVAQDTGQRATIEVAALGMTGACYGEQKRWAEAEAALTTAIAAGDAANEKMFTAQNRWELADELVKRGQRARGLVIAREAVAHLTGLPPPATEMVRQIEEWIIANRGPASR